MTTPDPAAQQGTAVPAASAKPASGKPIPSKPMPQPTPASQPFWDACRRHELRIQRCTVCGTLIHYPKLRCPKDGSDKFEWALMSGRATVHSFVVARRAFHPAFAADLPSVMAAIELEEGVRLLSNVVGIEPEAVVVGMPLELIWDDSGLVDGAEGDAAGYPLPKFRPAQGTGA